MQQQAEETPEPCDDSLLKAAADANALLPVAPVDNTALLADGFKDDVNFSDTRTDPYYWMMDPTRSNTTLLQHIHNENEYTAHVLGRTHGLQSALVKEMMSRQPSVERTAPMRMGDWYYYAYRPHSESYWTHARRPVLDPSKGYSEDDVMDTGQPEHVVLDESLMAQEGQYFDPTPLQVSEDQTFVAFGVDREGNELYDVNIVDMISSESMLDKQLTGTASASIAWAQDNRTLFYCTQEVQTKRPNQVWRYTVGEEEPVVVYEEPDEAYDLMVGSMRSRQFLHIVGRSNSVNYHVLQRADSATGQQYKVVPSKGAKAAHSLEAWGDWLFMIAYDDDRLINGQLCLTGVEESDKVKVLHLHSNDVLLEDLTVSRGFLVVQVRVKGSQQLWVYQLPHLVNPLYELPDQPASIVTFDDVPNHSLSMGRQPPFDSDVVRVVLRSLLHPDTTIDINLHTGKRVVKHVDEVENYRPGQYEQQRLWVPSHDGVQVPVSIVLRPDAVHNDGHDPVLLRAYGAYGASYDPEFSSEDLSLLDRGFVLAIAHVRGGKEVGGSWYQDGRLMRKKNTFEDLLAVSEYLIDSGRTNKENLCLWGRSAGGLAVGAALTMHPGLFKCAVMDVPFVDVLTTMRDPSQPLVAAEWDEWGDPLTSAAQYQYIKSYSPYDNIKQAAYPSVLITAGMSDSRVAFWEPLKFAARLRALKTDSEPVLVKVGKAGHFSASVHSERLQETAAKYAFLLLATGTVCRPAQPPSSSWTALLAVTAIALLLLLLGAGAGFGYWLWVGGEERRASVLQGMRRAAGRVRGAAGEVAMRTFPRAQGYAAAGVDEFEGEGDRDGDDAGSDGDSDIVVVSGGGDKPGAGPAAIHVSSSARW